MPLDESVPRYCSDHATFKIAADRRSIKFFPCGTVSHHAEDVRHRYCARCHRFFEQSSERKDQP